MLEVVTKGWVYAGRKRNPTPPTAPGRVRLGVERLSASLEVRDGLRAF